MNIEDITAPPPRLSPQMRYASLHRAVEGGLATDRTWAELIEVCLELELNDEATSCFWHIGDAPTRRRLLAGMQKRGLMLDVSLGAAESGDPTISQAAGPPRMRDDPDSIAERILDGFRFLFLDHMPLTAVVATVTFPIVVGLGGFLTAGVPGSFVLPLLALIPALSVVGLVGALGRRILVEASRGLEDPPEIPSLHDLVPQAGRFLLDATILVTIFLGPAALLAQFEATGISSVLAALAVGLTLFPMAMALRQTRDDWSCLKAAELFRAVARGGLEYMALVATGAALFAPSIVALWMTGGSHLYLVLSVIGPLAVTPTLVMSRLLGCFLFAKRREIITATSSEVPEPVLTTIGARPRSSSSYARVPSSALRAAVHPEARRAPARQAPAVRPSGVTPRVGAPAARSAAPRPASAGSGLRAAAAASSGRARSTAAPQSAARPAPAARPPASRPPLRAAGSSPGIATPRLRTRQDAAAGSGSRPAARPAPPPPPVHRRSIGEEMPDLTQMPGVSVLKGDARIAAGAAAPTRPTQ